MWYTSDEHMSPKMPENVKLVSPEVFKSWRVEDREKYIDTVLMDFLTTNSDYGLTIDDLKTVTNFDRRTISVHLEKFVARGEVYKELRGKRLQIFRTNGQSVGKPEFVKTGLRDHYFRLYRLENNDGNFVYIQEREVDSFKRDNVKGVIKIRDEELQDFIKKLHAFAVRVTNE